VTVRAIILLSGGMDSTTLAYSAADDGHDLYALMFDYGQRHRSRELSCAVRTAEKLASEWAIVNLAALGKLLGGSALTDDVEVPEGHYSAETMKATVVPNRNAIMLNIAIGIAVAEQADAVLTAVHAGDHPIYPDCRPEFIDRLNDLQRVATDGFRKPNLEVIAPFVNIEKSTIAARGEALGVSWADTWSCYVGGEVHCGKCGTCVERQEAFELAGVADPTEYADPHFWREAVASA